MLRARGISAANVARWMGDGWFSPAKWVASGNQRWLGNPIMDDNGWLNRKIILVGGLEHEFYCSIYWEE